MAAWLQGVRCDAEQKHLAGRQAASSASTFGFENALYVFFRTSSSRRPRTARAPGRADTA